MSAYPCEEMLISQVKQHKTKNKPNCALLSVRSDLYCNNTYNSCSSCVMSFKLVYMNLM